MFCCWVCVSTNLHIHAHPISRSRCHVDVKTCLVVAARWGVVADGAEEDGGGGPVPAGVEAEEGDEQPRGGGVGIAVVVGERGIWG